VARLHAELRVDADRRGRPLPFADGQIAAIAVAHGLTLVTRNLKDFTGVSGLRLVDWFEG
jgi:tRNA(fMet)-specific endonuclease VapC